MLSEANYWGSLDADPFEILATNTIWIIRVIALSMSLSFVQNPKLKRTDERNRSSGIFIATKVGEGLVDLLAQAEPRETAYQQGRVALEGHRHRYLESRD